LSTRRPLTLPELDPFERRLADAIGGFRGVRVPITALWDAAAAADLGFIGDPDGRIKLLAAIQALAGESVIAIPISKSSWDNGVRPALPRWVSKEVPDRALRLAAREEVRRALSRARLHVAIRGNAQRQAWLDALSQGGTLTKIAGSDSVRALDEALKVLAELPIDPPVARSVLATRLTRSSHGLDDDTATSRLVLRALSLAVEGTPPKGAAAMRSLWERQGVICDVLSPNVLVLGLRIEGDGSLAQLLEVAARAGEPLRLTLRMFTSVDSIRALAPRVYVCENPSVVQEAAAMGVRQPIVCIEGNASTAAMRLVALLAEGGVELRYHGDFDWKGLEIASAITRQGALPWRFSTADYERAMLRPANRPVLSGAPRTAPWDEDLGPAMTAAGFQVAEEEVMDELLSDLSVTAIFPGAPRADEATSLAETPRALITRD
jgi:uncharacterized protein (TIGR02679 family)